jgi:hypothetical protein
LLRLCFSRAVVKVWQAVKVWPLHGPNPPKFCKASVGERERERERDRQMKRAELGLLEVLGLLVRMPGEGDVTALPCFVGS